MPKVEIREGAVWAKLDGPEEALRATQELLTVENPKAKHSWAYKRGYSDGTVKFFSRSTQLFLAGLSERVRTTLTERGFTVTLGRPPFQVGALLAPLQGLTLRPYQLAAVDEVFKRQRLALQSPTGSGKTEIGLEIVRRAAQPTLWLVNSASLFEQTQARMRERLPHVPLGLIQGKTREPRLLTLAMVQTLAKLPTSDPLFRTFKVLIMDEAHHASAETWSYIAKACSQATLRVGLSGTALTRDPVRDLRLEGLTGPIHVVEETLSLAEQGFLAKPRIVFLDVPPETFPSYPQVRQLVAPTWQQNPRQLSTMGHKLFAKAYSMGILDNKVRTEILLHVATRHLQRGEKVLILCWRRPHAQVLTPLLRQRVTLPVAALDGTASLDERDAVLSQFKAVQGGAALVCTPFFREGMDLPELDVAILAGGGQSEIAVLQSVGRALRPRPDKPEALIYDMWDGHSMTDAKDYLMQHTLERLNSYRRQGWAVTKIRLRSGGGT